MIISLFPMSAFATESATSPESAEQTEQTQSNKSTAGEMSIYVSPLYENIISYEYIDENGEDVEVTENVNVLKGTTDSNVKWSGWVYVDGDVKIEGKVTMNDNVNLILADDASLEITKGILGNKTLVIYSQRNGDGVLAVTGTEGDDDKGSPGGNGITGDVVIYGGKVSITGGNGGDGGYNDDYDPYVGGAGGNGVTGSLTISGGEANVIGGVGGGGDFDPGSGGIGVNGDLVVSGSGIANVTGGTGGTPSSSSDGGIGGIGVMGAINISDNGKANVTGATGGYSNGCPGNGGNGATGVVTVTGGTAILTGGTALTGAPGIAFNNDNTKMNARVQTSTDGNIYSDWDSTTDLKTFYSLKLTSTHTHSFTTYAANDNVITATCANSDDNCNLTNNKIALTLTADGGTYDGTTVFSAITDDETVKFAEITGTTIDIQYYKGNEKIDNAPVDVGTYTAKLTLTDANKDSIKNGGNIVTATKEFTVSKANQTAPVANVGYTIDYETEMLVASDTTYEVRSSNTALTPLTDNKVTPGSICYVRLKETDTHNASPWTEINVALRPNKPNTTIESTMENSITVTPIEGGEYKLDDGSWQDSNEFTGLDAATKHTVHVRIKAVENSSFASEVQDIDDIYTNAATLANSDEGCVVDYEAEQVEVKDGYEISKSNNPFTAETLDNGNLTDGKLTLEPNTAYYVRKAQSGDVPPSEAVSFQTAARHEEPSDNDFTIKPESVENKKDGSLGGITEAMEYSLDNGDNWIPGPAELTGLSDETVRVRTAATAEKPHGEEYEYTFTASENKLTVTMGDTVTQVAYGESLTRPDDPEPVKEGYTFGGWYEDEACTHAWNFAFDNVKDTMTLYPKWIKNSDKPVTTDEAQITGQSDDIKNAKIELYRGTELVVVTATDEDGKYNLGSILKGDYNLVITSNDGKVTTSLIHIDSPSVPETEIPDKAVNSKVEHTGEPVEGSKADISSITVGGMDTIAEKANPQDGDKIIFTMTVTPLPKDESSESQNNITAEASGNALEFFDLKLTKQENNDPPQSIGSDNDELIKIVIPFNFSGVNQSSIAVYRYHEDEVDKLERDPNRDGEYFVVDAAAGTITVYAKKFSTYAVGYTNISSNSGGSGKPSVNYTVNVYNADNGQVSADRETADTGNAVTITAVPDEGFMLSRLAVTDKDGKDVIFTGLEGNKYTFTMPASDVNINAAFVKI